MSIGKNTALGVAVQGISIVLGLALSVVLARSLGAAMLGISTILTTTTVLLAGFIELGVTSATSTYLARSRYSTGEVSGVVSTLALLLGVFAALATAVAFPLLEGNVFLGVPFEYLIIALAVVPLTLYQQYWGAMLIGLNRLALSYSLSLGANVVSTVLIIVFVGLFNAGLGGYLMIWSCTALVTTTIMFVLAWRIERPVWPPRRATVRDMLGFGLRSHGNNIAQQVAARFDVYAVNPLLGSANVGYYGRATNLAEKLWSPLSSIYAASLSKIAQLPRDESALITAKIVRAALLLMLSMAVPFGLISPWLIPALYGADFIVAVPPLLILLVAIMFSTVSWVLSSYIVGQMQRPGLLSIMAWIQLGFSIPAYLLLIVWLGIIGAAIASLLTYLLAMIGSLAIFLRDSKMSLVSLFMPRASDWQDYRRLIESGLARVGSLLKRD